MRRTRAVAFFLGVCCAASFAADRAPDWLRSAVSTPVPAVSDEVGAAILLDEHTITVSDNGESSTLVRRAIKILRTSGRDWATLTIPYDNQTRISNLHAWSIPASGREYDLDDKDAVEISPSYEELYTDERVKVVKIPGSDPGAVIGYEYQQRERPSLFQEAWWFQHDVPVLHSRFTLQLPKGWEYDAVWSNYPPQKPGTSGDAISWEVSNTPALDDEPSMPAWRSLAGHMALTYFASTADAQSRAPHTWNDIGKWYENLASSELASTPEIKQKVAALTAGIPAQLDKIKALATYAQGLRYVAVEVGIGGYLPHPAAEVFKNGFGDCKDKATLLASMLHELGVESFYVLVHASRGVVTPDFPTMTQFNHVILAIRAPAGMAQVPATFDDAKLGRLVIFDPTDDMTPFGLLPPSLQSGYGLLVASTGGELVQLPLLSPETNRLDRSAKLTLNEDGTLFGEVTEVRGGAAALESRSRLLNAKQVDRRKVLEGFLSDFMGGFTLVQATAEGLKDLSQDLVLHYTFSAKNYAKPAGDLLLVRPRVLGEKADLYITRPGHTDRKYPIEFDHTSLQTDTFEITLPPGYAPDDLPEPMQVKSPFGSYQSGLEVHGNVLRYTRRYEVDKVLVPVSQLPEMKQFLGTIITDEENSAVLKKVQTATK